ncbi:MAG: 4Fe-4S dicluster domain-containing protein, partial [Clostridiales bacterium]|nr:4Fe-4S dicluster domain-containing protein [Clostridiales bacterium]
MDEAKRLITVCLDKEEPFCASACPFHYDTREFAARLRRGSFNAAFRLFANAVGFPSIVTALCDEPCKSACPRTKTDAAIELRRLERAALDHAANIKPNSYNLPPKDIKIAVIGAGLEGLGCALRLCNRKYQITLFEKSGRIGGSLWDKLPPEVFLNDIETQFMYEQYTLRLNEEIDGPETLSGDFDYVYMAAGAGSAGLSDMEKLAKGLRAAALIEGYLKTGVMKPDEPHKPTRMKLDPAALFPVEPAVIHGGALSKDEAVTEAKRCIGCRCDACYRHCAMMAYFDKFPSRIADEVAVTVNPGTLDGNGTVATRLISTCNQCGLCAEVCPEDIDVGAFLRASHSAMREKGAMPWAFHDFWLRDMAQARGPEYAFHGLIDGTDKKPRYLFFPGCQLSASEPRYATGAYRLLLQAASDTAIALGCCGAPAIWAGDMPLAGTVFT